MCEMLRKFLRNLDGISQVHYMPSLLPDILSEISRKLITYMFVSLCTNQRIPNNANSLAACWPLLPALSAIHSENCMPCAGPHLHHLFSNQPVVTLSISVDTRNVRLKFVGLEGALSSSASVVWGCVTFPQETNNSCDNRNC